ncbi:hypothetical protein [Lentzea pudingi]|uniref:hypothetical protein n=1 Tax=Lentzea pudingi TaxID=1789439 RepID=UPI00166C014A|nr:hypothetical protein [Lentzea pudingi]
MTPDFLLVRAADHVVLGVSWHGFDVVAGPALRAGVEAMLTLTFPPQHIAEQVNDDGPPPWYAFTEHLRSRAAGPSRVTFLFHEGAVITLTVEGILAAVRGTPVFSAATAIELPWRLVLSPEAGSGAEVVCTHEHTAGSFDVAVWRTVVGSANGLVLRSLDEQLAATPEANFRPSLDQFTRSTIHRYSSTAPAACERLELSSLGGTLSVRADWGAFAWEHHARLGRDVRVRNAWKCVLWPFGHRVEYVQLTERVYLPWRPSILGLKQTRTVVLTERVRARPEDARLAHAFPFGAVEIVENAVTGLDPLVPVTMRRPAPDAGLLQLLIDQQRTYLAEAEQAALDVLYGPGHTMRDFAPASPEEVFETPHGEHPPPEVERWRAIRDEIGYLESLLGGAVEEVPLYARLTKGGAEYRFSVRLAGTQGDVHVSMPLLLVFDESRAGDAALGEFHTTTDPEALRILDQEWQRGGAGVVATSGARIDLVGAGSATDVHEVHRLNIVGNGHANVFAPTLGPVAGSQAERWAVDVALPAVRALQGSEGGTLVTYAEGFLDHGAAEDVALRLGGDAAIDFVGRSMGSGGLIAPQLAPDAISRAHGLVQSAAALPGGGFDPEKIMGAGATLLGLPITTLLGTGGLTAPPAITQSFVDGRPPEVRMLWENVELHDSPPFVSEGTTMRLDVVTGVPEASTTCSLSAFELRLPATGPELLRLRFSSLTFTHHARQVPSLSIGPVTASFVGLLGFLQELERKVGLGTAAPTISVTPQGIQARYSLPVPSVSCGAFALRNIVFAAAVEVPFDGRPVSTTLAFASRAAPFNLSVLMFGGGGYLELEVDSGGLRRLEAALEFGASIAVNFGIASAEVHAMGGIRYLMDAAGEPHLTGFLRLGGAVELLGLISVSVELRLELTYDGARNSMVGRATLVVDIDLTFYSASLELDSGDWEFVGGSDPASRPMALLAEAAPVEHPLDTWRRYRGAFAGRLDHE